MTGRRWSLARRLRATLTVGTTGIVIVVGAINFWLLEQAVEGEIAALVREELEEFKANWENGPRTRDHYVAVVEELQREHPDVALAFRIDPGANAEIFTLGAARLVENESRRAPIDVVGSLGRAVRWSGRDLEDGASVECAIEAKEQIERLQRLEFAVGGVTLGAALLALLVGELLARRITGMLASVAQSVGAQPGLREPFAITLPDPPNEIREVVEALRALVERARSEDARTRLLISGLAHELRAPIQNLVLESEVAMLEHDDDPVFRDYAGRQMDLGRELGDAVDNLVSLCRSEDPTSEVKVERFDLGTELDLRKQRLRAYAERAGAQLVVRRSGDLVLDGDRETVMRAVRNLVANALEWTRTGTDVELELVGDSTAVTVRVLDRGPGIPAKDLERAFQPFTRLDQGPGRRAGYGLGLSLVRRAAELHGGDARLEPREGGGTVATLVLSKRGMKGLS
ncbi:MAG: HAMP domain-containing sensor histidine kinase [Planctomycetota bacterium]